MSEALDKLYTHMEKIKNNPKVQDQAKKYMASPVRRTMINSGLTGGIGIASGLFDDEADTAFSLLGKAGAAIAIEHALEEGAIMAGHAYAKKKGVPAFASKYVLGKFNVTEAQQKLVTGPANEYIKNTLPAVSKVKLGAGIVGAAAGLGVAMFDNKDDGMMETAGKMTVGAGVGLLGYQGYQHFKGDKSKPGSVMNDLAEKLKTGDFGSAEEVITPVKTTILQGDNVPKGEKPKITVKDTVLLIDNQHAKEVVNKKKYRNLNRGSSYHSYMKESYKKSKPPLDGDRIFKKAKAISKMGGTASKVAFGVIGISALVDISNGLDQDKEVQRMVADQEKNLKRKTTREARSLKQDGYDYVNMGEIVNEMFNERIGHYKMGNAKFQ